MNEIKFYLFPDKRNNSQEEFDKLVAAFETVKGVTVQRIDASQVKLNYEKFPYHPILELSAIEGDSANPQKLTILNCERIDYFTPHLSKLVSNGLGYRVFNTVLGCFLPRDPELVDATTEVLDPKMIEVMNKKGFKPLFHFARSVVFYAQSSADQSIHLLNSFLFEFFNKLGIEEDPTPEFSYKVAPNLLRFISMYDSGLIPKKFYDYYGKTTKIINQSGFNLDNPGRKIFVKPFIFELEDSRQEFYTIAGEGSALLYCDKIRPGETLDITIKRLLIDLKLAEDYIGARVHPNIEFDRDKEGIITPRILVSIYLEKLSPEIKESIKQRAQRTWQPVTNTGI